MQLTILTEKNEDFKILDGIKEIVDFKYLTEGQIMEEAGAVFRNAKISIFPQTAVWGWIPFLPKQAKILKDNRRRGEIILGGWNGHLIQIREEEGFKKKFRLLYEKKTKGKFTLQNKDRKELLELVAYYQILERKMIYEVDLKSEQLSKTLMLELLIYSIYAVNFLSAQNPKRELARF